MDLQLRDKVAIVTGSTRGLGFAAAKALASEGCLVTLCARTEPSLHAALAEVGRAAGGSARVHMVRADVSDRDGAASVIGETVERFGGIDVLVNNVGIQHRAPLLEFPDAAWQRLLDTNLTSAFLVGREVARGVVARGRGKIINIASMLSFQGGIRVPSYTASKSAVMGLTRIMANEFAAHGINVNAIAPGYMETDNTAALRADAKRNAEILARIPAGRWGSPEDLQGAVVFLASAASDYMQGYTVAVDGGCLSR